MGQYLKDREKNGGKENVKTQLTLKGKRKEQMKCHIFFLLCKAYERKEYVLVYCKALHFYSKKRYTLIFFPFLEKEALLFLLFFSFFFFLFLRVKTHYTLEVDKDNNWASIGMSDIHG